MSLYDKYDTTYVVEVEPGKEYHVNEIFNYRGFQPGFFFYGGVETTLDTNLDDLKVNYKLIDRSVYASDKAETGELLNGELNIGNQLLTFTPSNYENTNNAEAIFTVYPASTSGHNDLAKKPSLFIIKTKNPTLNIEVKEDSFTFSKEVILKELRKRTQNPELSLQTAQITGGVYELPLDAEPKHITRHNFPNNFDITKNNNLSEVLENQSVLKFDRKNYDNIMGNLSTSPTHASSEMTGYHKYSISYRAFDEDGKDLGIRYLDVNIDFAQDSSSPRKALSRESYRTNIDLSEENFSTTIECTSDHIYFFNKPELLTILGYHSSNPEQSLKTAILIKSGDARHIYDNIEGQLTLAATNTLESLLADKRFLTFDINGYIRDKNRAQQKGVGGELETCETYTVNFTQFDKNGVATGKKSLKLTVDFAQYVTAQLGSK